MALNILSNSGKTSYNVKELIADEFADLPLDGIAIGSLAYVVADEKHYMFNSLEQWIEVNIGSGGGGSGGMNIVPLGEGEYDPSTREPIIDDPQEKTIYLVPNPSGTSSDMWIEWIWMDGAWEKFGGASLDLEGYVKHTNTIEGEIEVKDSTYLIDNDGKVLFPHTSENEVLLDNGDTLSQSLNNWNTLVLSEDKEIMKAVEEKDISYSPIPVYCGKWIDGKDIHRRVYVVSEGIAMGNTIKVAEKPVNMELCVRAFSIVVGTSASKNVMTNSNINTYVNNDGVYVVNNFTGYADRIYVILEYTVTGGSI